MDSSTTSSNHNNDNDNDNDNDRKNKSSSSSGNKIREIVRLQQILKKWKKLATTNNAPKSNITAAAPTANKSINKFLKKTLSFSESTSSGNNEVLVVPKGYLAVCVGKELKRFVIPTEYLGHEAFGILLREAEDEFGFQQEGVLKIPCEVTVFQKILKKMILEQKRPQQVFFLDDTTTTNATMSSFDDQQKDINLGLICYNNSPDNSHNLTPPQLCR